MISISRAQNELAQKDKAIETLDQAIELLQGTTDPEDKRTLISLYMEKLRNIMIRERIRSNKYRKGSRGTSGKDGTNRRYARDKGGYAPRLFI